MRIKMKRKYANALGGICHSMVERFPFSRASLLRAPQGTGFDRLDRYRVRCKRKEGLVVAGICTAVSWNRPKAREGHPAILQTVVGGGKWSFVPLPSVIAVQYRDRQPIGAGRGATWRCADALFSSRSRKRLAEPVIASNRF